MEGHNRRREVRPGLHLTDKHLILDDDPGGKKMKELMRWHIRFYPVLSPMHIVRRRLLEHTHLLCWQDFPRECLACLIFVSLHL